MGIPRTGLESKVCLVQVQPTTSALHLHPYPQSHPASETRVPQIVSKTVEDEGEEEEEGEGEGVHRVRGHGIKRK